MTDFQIKVSMIPLIDQHYWPNVFVKNILKEIFLHIYKNLFDIYFKFLIKIWITRLVGYENEQSKAS